MPFGPHILALLETALAECFQYHSGLDTFLQRSGIGAQRLAAARHRAEDRNKMSGRFAKAPKRFVAQEIVRDLDSGMAADDRLTAVLITSFCKGSFPDAQPPGIDAIKGLQAAQVVERKEAAERRAEKERQQREVEQQREKVRTQTEAAQQKLRQSFLALNVHQNYQQRGFALEKFLNAFFDFEGLSPRGSFRITGEQIDGSFAWAARTYLVEAKWVKEPIGGEEFGAFMYKMAGKTADTRGLYISINGYSPQAIMGLNGKGELRFTCIDGAHLLRSLEPGRNFKLMLELLWRHASETGEAYLPVSSPAFLSREV